MSEYLFVVSGTVIIAANLTAIAPEGKISGVVKTAVKLVCLIVIAEPIAKYFVLSGKGEEPTIYDKNIFDETVITVDEDFIKYCSELRIAETEKAIEAVLADEYDLTASVTISWRTEEDGRIGILGISVETPAPAEKNVREKIERELGEKYGTTITFGTEKQAKKNDERKAARRAAGFLSGASSCVCGVEDILYAIVRFPLFRGECRHKRGGNGIGKRKRKKSRRVFIGNGRRRNSRSENLRGRKRRYERGGGMRRSEKHSCQFQHPRSGFGGAGRRRKKR